jgi:hypothetical protein
MGLDEVAVFFERQPVGVTVTVLLLGVVVAAMIVVGIVAVLTLREKAEDRVRNRAQDGGRSRRRLEPL